jgi:hypothetical protein
MSDKKPKSIPIKDLRQELASSPDMEPYLVYQVRRQHFRSTGITERVSRPWISQNS